MRLVGVDVANPSDIREVGATAPFPHVVSDVAISGTLAYVAAGGAGLRVVDISNPARPAEVGAWDSRGYAEGVTVAGSIAYLADGPYGLRVVDLSKPSQPVEVGAAYPMNYAYNVAVQGHYAYIAAAGAGLLIADVADPRHPIETGSLATSGYAYGVAVEGDTAYVADAWEGVKIVNIADPAHPYLAGTYKTPGWALGVAVAGARAYVADAFGGLRVLDVTDPRHPVEVASATMPLGRASSVAMTATLAFVADENFGLRVIGLTGATTLPQVGVFHPMGYADSVAVAGSYAYIAAGRFGLAVIDVSDAARPRQVGNVDTEGYARDVAVSGNFACVVTMHPAWLHVVDISNPAQPFRTASYDIQPGQGRGLDVLGANAFITDEWSLRIVSVSDPNHPVQSGVLRLKEHESELEGAGEVSVNENTAYLASGQAGLTVASISDRSNPIRVGSYNAGTPMLFNDVAVAGNRVYVADSVFGLRILDVSVPAQPVAMGSLQMLDPEGVVVDGNLVYVASGDHGLNVVDASDPYRPVLAGTFNTPGYARKVASAGGRVYVADGTNGLLILERTTGTSGQRSVIDRGPSFLPPSAIRRAGPPGISNPSMPVRTESRRHSESAAAAGTPCLVTSTSDSGTGTLRWCLENSSSGSTITFDGTVFPPATPASIHLVSRLPGLRGNVTIDASDAGVILDGSGVSQPAPGQGVASGLSISSDGNRVMGLQILRFPANGIDLLGSDNVIGGDRTRGRGPTGRGNVISGNKGSGIAINRGFGTASSNNVVGNLIGTDVTGTKALGNGYKGLFVVGGENNRIGGLGPQDGNVISGNVIAGLSLSGGATGNLVAGNFIGTDLSGSQSVGNLDGVVIDGGAFNNVIQGNLSSGNRGAGVLISDWGTSYNAILGNRIGTDATGTRPVPNGGGVSVGFMSATYNRIGGTRPGERNLISGNGGGAIGVQSPGTLIRGNDIGIDITGRRLLGNNGGSVGLGGGRSILGGTTSAEANVIGGSGWFGVGVESDYNAIMGNYIGTDASGQVAIGNVAGGIAITGAEHTVIQGNVIANTVRTPQNGGGDGIAVRPGSNTTIRRNSIHSNAGYGISGAAVPPVISSVGTGSVSGTACPGCDVEIFSDSQDEGRVFEGSVVAGASGSFTLTLQRLLIGPNVTATATDSQGNTSQFSVPVAAPPPPPRRRAVRPR